MAAAVSKVQLARAIAALEMAGKPVNGLLCRPDGSVAVLTQAPPMPEVVVTPECDWIDLVGDEAAGKTKAARGRKR